MLDTYAKRQVAAELRAVRHQQSTPTGRWIVCPSSLAAGVDPHAVQVLRKNRHYAYCGTCELQFGLHGPLWDGAAAPLTLSKDEAASWLTRLKQLKSPTLELPANDYSADMGLPHNHATGPSGNARLNDHR